MSHRFTGEELGQFAAAAQPYSDAAKAIKGRCDGDFLLPPEMRFMAHIDSCIASVGAGKVVEPDNTETEKPMRVTRLTVADYRQALSRWLVGWPRRRARAEFLLEQAVVDEVYDTLGDVSRADEHQKSVVEMMVARLDPVSKDLTRPDQLHERLGAWDPPNPTNIEERFFHDITRLDLDTWKILPNIRAMIRNIAAKNRVAEVHCWIGNPEDVPPLRLRVKAIRDWFDGKTEEPDTRAIAATLGDPNAYKEKRWLASSLLNLLDSAAEDESVLRLIH